MTKKIRRTIGTLSVLGLIAFNVFFATNSMNSESANVVLSAFTKENIAIAEDGGSQTHNCYIGTLNSSGILERWCGMCDFRRLTDIRGGGTCFK